MNTLSDLNIDTGGFLQPILAIAVIGLIVWLLLTYVPMPAGFKTMIYVLAIVIVVLILFRALGVHVN